MFFLDKGRKACFVTKLAELVSFSFTHIFSECDVSVSKLLGFETFPFFWVVSDSVSEKFGIEKSIGFGIEKNWYRSTFGYFGWRFGFETSRLRNFSFFRIVSDLVSKNVVSKKVSDLVS